MRRLLANTVIIIIPICMTLGCGRGRSLYDIHSELVKKMETVSVVEIDWGVEQKKWSSLPETNREEFLAPLQGKKVRASLSVKEFKPADMALFQKAFAGFNYYEKERFNFDKLMVVTANGRTYDGIETSFVVFLPNEHLFDFTRGQEIAVEGLVDNVSFTFYNCHIALYPARLASK